MASLAHATINAATEAILVQKRQNTPGSSTSSTSNSNSVSTLISTLVPVLLVALVWGALFLILRNKFPRHYHPRTFLGSLHSNERSPDLPQGRFNWFGSFFNIPDSYILNHHSLDGFLFLRLLKMAVLTCVVGCCITFPILLPVNATGGGGKSQLDVLTLANVTNNYYRYFAHTACAYIFFGFIMYMITRESIYYINLRQAYLLSPLYASRMSSRTVLFTSVPEHYCEEENLRAMFGKGVKRVWIASDCKELDDLVKQRDKAAMKLEGAETKLITTANKNRLKSEKKHGRSPSEEIAITADTESGSVACRYITPKERPTHRLKMLIGKKVDSIDWCRAELQKLIPQIDTIQSQHQAHESKKVGSVFVEFTTLAEAQAAFQSLTHHHALHMSPRFAGMTPGEIIWKNLGIKWWQRSIRIIISTSFIVWLVVFWSIPVAFVGAISNINYLTSIPGMEWLNFINDIPSVILGVVTGLLPTILLAVLMALLPIVLRMTAKFSGDPTLSAVELTVQNYYFAFQIIDVFLVATLGSAASSAVGTILKDPSGIAGLLASSIPKASNFYLSYFVLQGLGVVSGMLVGIVGLLVFFVLGKFLDKTPRKMYKRWTQLSGLGWGTVFPIYTNLFVIAICYSCIAPLVLLFAAIGLYLFYFAFRYNLLFVYNANIDTKGKVYPRALQQVFVGLYMAEFCLIGLFAIGTGQSIGALGPLILMIALMVFTALYHMTLNAALGPLIHYLPRSLESEERRLIEEERASGSLHTSDDKGMTEGHNGYVADESVKSLGPAPHKKPSFLQKFIRPDIYTDYATMRRLVPRDIEIKYEEADEQNAYFNPSIRSATPLLWIPRDSMGISKQEIRDTEEIIPITDVGASLDAKGKVIWDADNGRPPIWQPTIYY